MPENVNYKLRSLTWATEGNPRAVTLYKELVVAFFALVWSAYGV